MAKNSFYDIASAKATKQIDLVDAYTEEAPILASIPMEPSSNGLKNVYEEVVSIDAAQAVDFDGAMTELNVDTEIKESSLSKFGGIMTVGEDKAGAMGGPGSYFGGKTEPVLMDTGAAMEQTLLYNNIRATAYANDKLVNAGGDQDKNYSILAVKWVKGQTTGLYDANGLGTGKAFDITPLSGGALYMISDGVPGYGQRVATYFGIQLANPRYVAGICNIDPTIAEDAAMVTEQQMDQLVVAVRGNSANTAIYMHPSMLAYLGRYKSSKLQMMPSDGDRNSIIAAWNGVPIRTSYNFLDGTETDVSFA